ncbi:hypothetical protein HDV05_002073, partial [Chytridiales sp. JEL 0842]
MFGGIKIKMEKRSPRVVVRIDPDDIYNPSALSMFTFNGKRKKLLECDGKVLWSVKHIRLDTPAAQRWRKSVEEALNTVRRAAVTDDGVDLGDFFTTTETPSAEFEFDSEEGDVEVFDDMVQSLVEGYDGFVDVGGDEGSYRSLNATCKLTDTSTYKEERMHVLVDIFHIFQRISKKLKKTHGAFRPFLRRLQDAFYLLDRDDLEVLRECLKTKGELSEEQVEKKLFFDRKFVFRHCRRYTPEKDELHMRVKRVYEVFHDIEDATTGQKLFSKEASKEMEN